MYLPDRKFPNGITTENTTRKSVKTDEAKWEAFWRALSRLYLRSLVAEIIDERIRVPEQTLLDPLNRVSAEAFHVILPWPTGLETTGDFGSAKFTVRRPPEGVNVMKSIDVESGDSGLTKWRRVSGLLR